jgi:stage V sporulation protein AD
LEDEFWGEKSWEKAESKIIKETVNLAVSKSGLANTDIDYCFAGDLLNQCISSDFGLRDTNVPFFGVFGACSTFVESMCLGSVFIEGGAANNVICATSSHFCSAEKQFRFPLELGTVAPAPAKSIKYLYNPSPPNIAPTVTNITSILAGVNLVLSNKI